MTTRSKKKKEEEVGETTKRVPASATERRRDLLVFLAIVVVALAVRLVFQARYDEKLGLDTRKSAELDCNTFDVWARRIAAGDALSRDMYHPWHWWAQEIAPLETWNRWYGEKTFHQAPLYPYFVALAYGVFDADPNPVPRLQAWIGALTAGLTFLLARRFVSRSAAAVAGALVALYGPMIFDEAHLLRENLLAPAILLFLLAAESACRAPSARTFARAGAALGLSMLVKESQVLFAPVLLAAPLLHPAFPRAVEGRRLLPRWLGAAALAFLVVLSPVFVRNAIVGARLFSLSTRGPEVIVAGNAASSDGVEWFPERTREALLERDAKRILNEADGSLLETVKLTLATHAENPLGFAKLLLRKLDAFFNGYEVPNNVDFAMMRLEFPLLTLLPDFRWIGPLALLGIGLAFVERRAAALSVPLLFLLIATVTTIGFFIVGRFRSPAVPAFAAIAGVAVDVLASYAAERRRVALAAAAGALLALAAALWPRGEPETEARLRLQIANLLLDSKRVPNAVEQLRASARAASLVGDRKSEVLARSTLARVLLDSGGDLAGAETELAAVIKIATEPNDRGSALSSLGNVRFREAWERKMPAVEKLPEAMRYYEEALAADPGPDAKDRDWVKTVHYGRASLLLWAKDSAPGLYPDALPRALAEAETALADDPEYGAARVVRGRALVALGRRDEGIAEMKRSLELFGPDESATAAQVEALLRGLGAR